MMVDQSAILYGDARSVLLFGDAPGRLMTTREIIETIGGRVAQSGPIDGSLDQIDRQITIDAVVVDATHSDDRDFEALAAHLNDAAKAGRYHSVIVMPAEMIDSAAATAWHSDIALLCDPSRFDLAAAIGTAMVDRTVGLSDVNSNSATPRLRQLSEEVSRIARALAAMSGEDQAISLAPPRADPVPARRGADATVDAVQVRAMIRARRLREFYFSADLFADPAWDMLLDLMAARLERRQVAVSSLCIAAAVPPTTALRWIKLLTDQGILLRIADPRDGRRVFIELADSAAEGMISYLAAAQRLATIAP